MNTSATKRIAKNFSWLFVGNSISGGLNFFLIIYIARVLGAASFGLLNFALAFMAYLLLIVDAGLSMFGIREIAKDREGVGRISLNLFAVRLLAAVILFTISAVVLYLLPISFEMRLLFVATFLFIFYRALNADWFFLGLEKMEYIALSKVAFSVLSLGLIVFLVKGPADLIKVPFVQFACGIFVSLIFLLIIIKFIVPLKLADLVPRNWWNYFVHAIPLGASMILVQVYNNVDTIMLGFMDKAVVVGYYNAAYRIFYILVGFFALWQAPAIPIVTKRINEDKARTEIFLEKYLRLTLLIVVPAVVFVFLAAPLIIGLVFGSQYHASSLALRILVWAFLPLVIGSTYGVLILVSAGNFKQFFWAVALGALVNIILNFILIPPFSYSGAAVATIMAEVFVLLAEFYFARKIIHLGLVKHLIKPLVISLASFIAVWAVYYLPFATGITRLFLSSAAFVAACSVLLVFIEREFMFSFATEVMRRE